MSLELVNDGERYSVEIRDHFHQKSYVIYVVTILDQCFNEEYKLCFRFKSLKNIHEKLIKVQKLKHLIPEFPKTRSFLFVNKTNRNSRNIADRARQLEYYIFKIFNNKELSNRPEIKAILQKAKMSSSSRRRSKSEAKNDEKERRKSSSLEKPVSKSSKGIPKYFEVQYL